jgi:hypothetical protein
MINQDGMQFFSNDLLMMKLKVYICVRMCVYVWVCLYIYIYIYVCVCVYPNHTRISGYVEITLCLSCTSIRTACICVELL